MPVDQERHDLGIPTFLDAPLNSVVRAAGTLMPEKIAEAKFVTARLSVNCNARIPEFSIRLPC
jgi:hypothetical protein